jgi:hypothetical protein
MENALGPDHPDLDPSLNYLADLYGARGQYVAAEYFYRRSLHVRELHLGRDHVAVAGCLENLARLYGVMGRGDDARRVSERATAIRSKAGSK